MSDWGTWPLFTLQLISVALFILPRDKKIFGVLPKTIILILLWIVMIGIVLSLYHNISDPLPLHF